MKILCLLSSLMIATAEAQSKPALGPLQCDSFSYAHFAFTGPVGARIDGNVDNWLLRAPQANPGMLEMFRLRDRQPAPQLVPWAGEFVGKYLISAVQALRMTDDPRLFPQVSNVVAAFISTQAEDGYLGPFPQEVRLLKNWDLWGHYHAISALVLWHQYTSDPAPLGAARKAADLVCRTYLDTGRRVFDAGDPEMNMSIITAMAMLYQITSEPRYLRMAHEVEKDWERAGDYLRAGLDGREYFQSPRPRWESLHDLQGLFELWRITGEPRYREAFIHHWRSIRRWDRRNTGAFSAGEQATGNPFSPAPIETCCTVAWMALTLDYLRLTGDPLAADDLEFATLNGGLGAQHFSGRWWTYNTPMDGVREASSHTIVFQARAGTPELNCCSVNGPRVLGLLGQWAMMSENGAVVLNSFLPGTFTLLNGKSEIRLVMDRDYPQSYSQRIRIAKIAGMQKEWTLRLRIPAWSTNTGLRANFGGLPPHIAAGSYLDIRRHWKSGDELVLDFDFHLRTVAGANEAAGKVSLYRGPLLLAYDQAYNTFDEDKIPALNLRRLSEVRTIVPSSPEVIRLQTREKSYLSTLQPPVFVQIDLPTPGASVLRLVDFASAGAQGSRYRSWLPVSSPPPPPAFTQFPRDGEPLRAGLVRFQWRGPRRDANVSYRLEIAGDAAFRKLLFATNTSTRTRQTLDLTHLSTPSGSACWWRIVTLSTNGETVPDVPPAAFTLSKDAPPQIAPPELKTGPNGELIVHSARGEAEPSFGEILPASFETRDENGTRLNGRDQMLRYSIPVWPPEDFSVAVRVRIEQMPKGRIGQIFSAWAAGMDDPLRLTVSDGKLSARIEAGAAFTTSMVPLDVRQWHHVAAVKRGDALTLFLDGRQVGSGAAPPFSLTSASDCALGGNPHFTGNEFLAATFADFGFWARALSEEELHHLASQ